MRALGNRGAFGKRRKSWVFTLTFTGGETTINQPLGAPAGAGFVAGNNTSVWIAQVIPGGTAGQVANRSIRGLSVVVQDDGSLWVNGTTVAIAPGTVLVKVTQL